MKIFSIFGNLNIKISNRFWNKVEDVIGLYFFVWFLLQMFFWIIIGGFDGVFLAIYWGTLLIDQFTGVNPPSSAGIINLIPLLNGFSLFEYFPYWLRIVLLIFITIGLISIPVSLLAFFSYFGSSSHVDYQSYSRSQLMIRCIECNNEIRPQGDWVTGETDIRCVKCGALMMLTIADGKFNKLILKQTRR